MSLDNNIPNGWEKTPIGEVVELAQGVAINKKTDFVLCDESKGVPLLKINNLVNNTVDHYVDLELVPQKTILEKDDVIFTRTGQVGWVFTNKFGVLHNNSFKVIPNDRLNKNFLYWFLKQKSIYNYVQKVASGSAQPDLNHGAFKTIEILLPSNIEEQKAIADILTAFDAKIENLQAQNKTLETTAQTIFKETFGEYQIGGDLPDGWRVRKIGEVAFNHSKSFKFTDDKVIFINTGDVLKGQFLHSNEIIPKGLPGQAKKAIELYDILYSEIRPKNKRFAFVDFSTPNYVVSTKFMVIRPLDDFSPFILYFILKSKKAIDEFNVVAESRSGTFPQITFDSIKNYAFILPPIEVQLKFEKTLKIIMSKQKNNTQQIQTLKNTRDTLLPKLMSGSLRVNDFKDKYV